MPTVVLQRHKSIPDHTNFERCTYRHLGFGTIFPEKKLMLIDLNIPIENMKNVDQPKKT